MLIEKVVGNYKRQDLGARQIERVFLPSERLLKRIQRLITENQRELALHLPQRTELKNGDILYMDDEKAIVIQVMPEEVLVIRPSSLKQMGEIAHLLGNRHLPAQFATNEMVVPYEPLTEELLCQRKIPYSRERRVLDRAFRLTSHHGGVRESHE